eukprot:Skav217679  [mRNA]  locus=scaffold2919:405232:408320:+ [translate_table: standard]
MATIWTWWSSGEETLTPFLQLCLKSWRAQHPNWKVVVLDSTNLWQYLTAEELPSTFLQIKRASLQSDLVRLAIMAKYGGCYVDMSSLAMQAAADAAWARISEGACLVGYRAPHFISDFVSAWFLAAPARDPIMVEWSKQFNHVMEGRLDDKDVHKHKFFQGVDLSDYLRLGALAPKPGGSASLWVEYLVVNVVLKAILDKNPSLKERFWSSACLVTESDPSLSPVLWSQAQEHLVPKDLAFPENEKFKMRNLLEQDSDFATRLLNLPMIKFFNSGSPFAHLSTEELLSSPSVLGSLIRKALGSLVDASCPAAEWPALPVLKAVPWPVPPLCPWTADGCWTPNNLPPERVAIATIVAERTAAVAALALARSLKKGHVCPGTAHLCLVPEWLDVDVANELELEGWQVVKLPVDVQDDGLKSVMQVYLWNLPQLTKRPWDRVLYIDPDAIVLGDLQELLCAPEMEPPLGGVSMCAEYHWSGAMESSSEALDSPDEDAVTVASTSMLALKKVPNASEAQDKFAFKAPAQAAASFKANGYCHAGVILLRPSNTEFQRLLFAQRHFDLSGGDLLHEMYTKRGLTKILPNGYNAQKWLKICASELWRCLDLKIITFGGTRPWQSSCNTSASFKSENIVECFACENSGCEDLVRLWHNIYQSADH